jgi:hypothetical protein
MRQWSKSANDKIASALDRFVLAAALLVGAAFAFPALTGSRVFAYFAGAVGLVALHERLRREFSPAVSALTSVLILSATSLFWSMTRASSAADAITFALTAAAVLAAARLPSRAARIAAWAVVGTIPLARAAGGGLFEWSGAPGHAVEILYSSARGFLSLTPVAYVALVGTIVYFRRDRTTALASLAMLMLCIVAASIIRRATVDPFDHGLTLALPLLAPGLALVIEYARSKPLLAAAPLVAGAVLWNYGLMVQYTAGMLAKDEPVLFAAMVRQQADVHTRSPYLYPFAFPANVYFAWREGIPVDRYELLSQEPRGRDWDAAMDRRVDRFLLDGWGGAGSTPSGPVRWTSGHRATLAFPLAPPSARATLELVTSARLEEPPVNAELAVEINGIEIGRFLATPSPAQTTLAIPPARVGRVLRAGYNRLTIVNYGIHRVNSADVRPLGPLAARSGDIPFPVAIHRIRVTSAS